MGIKVLVNTSSKALPLFTSYLLGIMDFNAVSFMIIIFLLFFQNFDLSRDARSARAYRDELDTLREKVNFDCHFHTENSSIIDSQTFDRRYVCVVKKRVRLGSVPHLKTALN